MRWPRGGSGGDPGSRVVWRGRGRRRHRLPPTARPLERRVTRIRAAWAGILTVELHRVPIRPVERISTTEMRFDARDRALTLTVGMHRASSRFGGRDASSRRRARSPLKSTAFRLASEIGYPHRISRRARAGIHSHRWSAQRFECHRRPDIHIGYADMFDRDSLSPLKPTAFRVASGGNIHTGTGGTCDRVLTFGFHSVSSAAGGRISTSNLPPRSIRGSLSPLKSTVFRVVPESRYPHRNRHRVPAGVHPHRWNAQRFECRRGGISTSNPPTRSIGGSRSPSRSTAFRVAPAGRYPHRNRQHIRSLADPHPRISQRSDSFPRPDIHTRFGAAPDEASALTIEFHSVSRRFDGGYPQPKAQRSLRPVTMPSGEPSALGCTRCLNNVANVMRRRNGRLATTKPFAASAAEGHHRSGSARRSRSRVLGCLIASGLSARHLLTSTQITSYT